MEPLSTIETKNQYHLFLKVNTKCKKIFCVYYFESMRAKYTDEDIAEAVKLSTSITGVLKKIGLKPNGANHESIKTKIKNLNLNISHFTGQGWCKGENHEKFIKKFVERPIKSILVKNSTYSSPSGVKKKLLKEGLLENKCYNCGIINWLNENIALQLHHIDRNKANNTLENLTILCPNCHSQTPNYGSKNCRKKKKSEIMSKDMVIRVEPSLFKKFQKKCTDDYKSISQVIRYFMIQYINKKDTNDKEI